NGAIDFSLNTGGQIENIQIELGNLVIAKETTYTDWRGNLNGGGEIADQASVLESEALFDASSGVLVAASESTLLQNLVRSSTGDSSGNAIDLNIEVGSTIELESNVGGTVVRREFIVGDPPPTGGMTLGDLRDWMQGALGINESATGGNEMISAQRINALTGEVVNGTLDQVGTNGFLSLTLGGADYQSVAGATGLANQNAPLQFMLDLTDAGGTAIAAGLTVNVVGTGAASLVTSADIQNALNSVAATQNLPAQFSVTGSFTNGFTITNTAGNSFNINGGDTALVTGADPSASAAAPTLGVSQQTLLQAGDTVTFDNFQPLMAAQTMTVVPGGIGNGANQFEIGANVAETASNLATAINLNPVMSGLVTASVVGNQIQLTAKNPGSDGNFTVQTTVVNASALIPSTVGIDVTNADVGDTMTVTADGNMVTSTLSSRVDPAVFPSVLPNGLTGTAGDATLEMQFAIQNLTNSPLTLSIPDNVVYATPTAFVNAVIAALDADANIIAAGLNGTFAATVNDTTGNFTITNSQNAAMSISAAASDPDDFGRVFTSSAASLSNGVKIQIVPQNGSAAVGFTAVEVGTTASATARNIAEALNSSIYTNPPLGASSLGSFVRITDESAIEAGQGNAVSAGSLVIAPTSGFSLEIGNTMIGAGASADTFVEPDPTDFANGTAIGTMIDDETNFVAAGVQVGDFIRFSTGPAAGLIAKIVQVGQVENPAIPGTLLSNPHAIQFEIQNTDTMPSMTIPSAYTIHEAAQVDIGVNSNLAASNPPNGLDTASDSGKLRVSGHVGSA
ncbi:MAG: hypothetical protein KDB07_08335, partial [Planctomycetes bacterium]|nr:hypothetical protein [Planctomycetota bacterium]